MSPLVTIMMRLLAAFLLTTTATTSALSAAIRPNTADYRALLLNDAPMMDVRAPMEFSRGSFPCSINLPLLSNEERHQVGICYKEQGQAAAVALGNTLVSGKIKTTRIKRWIDFCRDNPDQGYLYCFRGGLRSHTVQQWVLEETGIHYPLITGGYKAMRHFLLDDLKQSLDTQRTDLIVICGKTGAGKTRAIHSLEHCSVDLEGLAHHRGSSFGNIPECEQPSQTDFENSIAIAFLKVLDAARTTLSPTRLFVEDEGNRIGRLGVPHVLRNRMKDPGGIVIIEAGVEERVDVLVEDYVVDLGRRFVSLYGDDLGSDMHRDFLLGGLKRIRNRLGGNRQEQLTHIMEAAFREQQGSGDTSMHRVWVAALLEHYYDKQYDYQLSKRNDQVLFRGSREAVIDWAMEATANQMSY